MSKNKGNKEIVSTEAIAILEGLPVNEVTKPTKEEIQLERLQVAKDKLKATCEKQGTGRSSILNQLSAAMVERVDLRLQELNVDVLQRARLFENASLALAENAIESVVSNKAKRSEKLVTKDNPKASAYSVLLRTQSLLSKEDDLRKDALGWTFTASK
jgi:hypothetical protein